MKTNYKMLRTFNCQMGEFWTLFEFACSLYLTCNMALEMDGNISRVLLCIMIFSILRLNGINLVQFKGKNIAGQSYRGIWGNFEQHWETFAKSFFCNREWPWKIASYMHYDVWNWKKNIGLSHIVKANIKHLQIDLLDSQKIYNTIKNNISDIHSLNPL